MPSARSDPHLLAHTALSQDQLSGLCEVLRVIAQMHKADGCILWEVVPGSNLETRTGSLFTLAQWIADNVRWTMDDLGLDSVAGTAAITGESILVPDVHKEPLVNKSRPFYRVLKPDNMSSTPVVYLDGAKGALTLYRKQPPALTSVDVAEIEQDVLLVPYLFQAIRDRVSFGLLKTINDILHTAEISTPDLRIDDAKSFITRICTEVSNTFNCLETSVFLEEPADRGHYKIFGTTWPGPVDKAVYEKDDNRRTSWVLNHGTAVNIFDVVNMTRDRESIQAKYAGFPCEMPQHFIDTTRDLLGLAKDDELQPLSFMAAPVAMGDKILGAIRCCAARKAPYYFAGRELALLTMVANRLSQFWGGWIREMEVQDENRSWHALVDSVGKMNTFVHHELSQRSPSEIKIWKKGLEVTKAAIPGAEVLSVRLRDPEDNHLFFAVTEGESSHGTADQVKEWARNRFTLDDPQHPASVGSHVYHSRIAYITDDVSGDPYFDVSAAFPGMKRMIVAPIQSEEEVFGVLDIQCTPNSLLPRHAKAIAMLLGEQLGLYHFLSLTIAELHKVPQVYEDLGHQLKTPVRQAYERVKALFDARLPPLLEPSLWSIRAVLFRARRVVNSTWLFAELAHKGHITIRPLPLTYQSLIDLLDQAASDNQLMVPPFRNIKFRVETGSFSVMRERELIIDQDIFAQALDNILDNAAKYSSQGTNVRITGGTTGRERDRAYISVANVGLRLGSQAAKLCRQRGWRGEEAEWTTGEGSGIGLWIVDHVMKAHNGELEILPTNRFGITEVRLIFPLGRK